MKIIVAGYPKTGTKSLNAALTELGYNVYDYMEHYFYHYNEWIRIYEGKEDIEVFKQMYKDVDAVVDGPACFFWYEIHQAFPDAKVSQRCIKSRNYTFMTKRSIALELTFFKVTSGQLLLHCYSKLIL